MALFLLIIIVVLLVVRERSVYSAYIRGYKDARDGVEPKYELGDAEPKRSISTFFDYEEQLRPQSTQSLSPQIRPVAQKTEADKAKESVRNLNVVLYVASFLFVAAAAALIASSVAAIARLIGLILVVALFYVGGLVLHHFNMRLRPAATAFIGTSLAVLPFVGLALTLLGGVSEVQSWLLISVIGIAAYLSAAVVLQNQLISYLSVAFIVSFALSAVASLQMPLVWYFVIMIGLSTIARLAGYVWPQSIPRIFRKPVAHTAQWVAPVAVTASLFVADSAPEGMYEIVFGVATAHYLVSWLLAKTYIHELIVRILAHCTLLIVIGNMLERESLTVFGIWWMVLALVQACYSVVRLRLHRTRVVGEQIWISVVLGLLLLGMVFWLPDAQAVGLSCISMAAMIVVGMAAVYGTKNWLWSVVGTATSIPLIVTFARHWLSTPVSWEAVISIFALLFAGALCWRAMTDDSDVPRTVASRTTGILYGCTLLILGLEVGVVASFWTYLIVGAGLVVASYIERVTVIEAIGAVLVACAVYFGLQELLADSAWSWLATLVVVAGGILVGASVHHRREERSRRNNLIVLASVVGIGLVTLIGSQVDAVRSTALILALVAAVIVFGIRQVLANRSSDVTKVMVISYHVYPLVGVLLATTLSAGWLSVALLIATILLWLGSYSERQSFEMVAGNITLVLTVSALWSMWPNESAWGLQVVTWLSAAVFYGLYWMAVAQKDMLRQQIQLYSTFAVLAVVAAATFFSYSREFMLAAAGTIVVLAIMLGVDSYLKKEKIGMELAIYLATFGLQRVTMLLIPDVHLVAYAHWWATTILLVAWWFRYSEPARYWVAAAFITSAVGVTALVEGGWYSLLFLIEHLAFVVIGAVLNRRWLLWWGVVASIVSIMYFLRDYVFLWLGMLGLVLIAVVIWRLNKVGQQNN